MLTQADPGAAVWYYAASTAYDFLQDLFQPWGAAHVELQLLSPLRHGQP
jgi:hypothetical protein